MSTREERAEATRAQLVAAARQLFSSRGYAQVGTEDLVRAAGLTRGALYHHFADKRELFAAVYEQVEQEVVAALGSQLAGITDPVELVTLGVRRYLDACLEPEVLRIALQDAPTVLGWARWREVGTHYGLGLITGALSATMDSGALARQPVRPLAHLLLAAMSEAAQFVAHASNAAEARAEIEPALLTLLASQLAPGAGS